MQSGIIAEILAPGASGRRVVSKPRRSPIGADGRTRRIHVAKGGDRELPAGAVEAGEPPETAAAREAREESGWGAKGLLYLGTVAEYREESRRAIRSRGYAARAPRQIGPRLTREEIDAGHTPMRRTAAECGRPLGECPDKRPRRGRVRSRDAAIPRATEAQGLLP